MGVANSTEAGHRNRAPRGRVVTEEQLRVCKARLDDFADRLSSEFSRREYSHGVNPSSVVVMLKTMTTALYEGYGQVVVPVPASKGARGSAGGEPRLVDLEVGIRRLQATGDISRDTHPKGASRRKSTKRRPQKNTALPSSMVLEDYGIPTRDDSAVANIGAVLGEVEAMLGQVAHLSAIRDSAQDIVSGSDISSDYSTSDSSSDSGTKSADTPEPLRHTVARSPVSALRHKDKVVTPRADRVNFASSASVDILEDAGGEIDFDDITIGGRSAATEPPNHKHRTAGEYVTGKPARRY